MSLAVVDVDGDGKDDSIGRAGGQIVVLTASGIEAAVAGTDSKLLTDPKAQDAAGFVGAWDVDGVPGAEVVVATKELGGSASYKVLSWEDANLAVMSPPASLYEGNPVEWKLHRGEGGRDRGSLYRRPVQADRGLEFHCAVRRKFLATGDEGDFVQL